MEIKIGNIFSIFLLLALSAHAVNKVTMSLTDLNGQAVNRVEVGEQLTLKVKVDDWQGQEVTVPGIQEFYHELRGSYKTLFTMNNMTSKSVEYEYFIRPEKIGNHWLGPVVVDGVNSNKIQVRVRHHVGKRHAAHQDFILECEPTKHSVVVGEKIKLNFKLKSSVDVHEFQIGLPDISPDAFTMGELQKDGDYEEPINDKTYHVYACSCEIIARKPGEWKFPEASCIARVPVSNRSMSRMFFNIGFGVQDKTFYARSFALDVKDLPACDRPVNAVGDFTDYQCVIDKTSAAHGEGIIIQLHVKGNGSFEAIESPKLQIPDTFNYYDSKIEMGRDGSEHIKKFEYIVQGMKPGKWTIPAQEFTFYSPRLQSFQTLRTQPRTIEIKAQQHNVPQVATGNNALLLGMSELNEHGAWLPRKERGISMNIFWLLVVLPFLLALSLYAFKMYQHYLDRYSRYYQYRDAFAVAHKKLAQATKNNKPEALYDLFNKLLQTRLGLYNARLNLSTIAQALQERGISEDALEQWQRFYHSLAQLAYDKQLHEHETNELFSRAAVWIDQLEELL